MAVSPRRLNKTWWVGGWPREWPRREPGPAGRVQDSGAAQCSFATPRGQETCWTCSLPSPGLPLRAPSHEGTRRAAFLLVGCGPAPTSAIQGSGSAAVRGPGPRSRRLARDWRAVVLLPGVGPFPNRHTSHGCGAGIGILGSWDLASIRSPGQAVRTGRTVSILPRHSPAQAPASQATRSRTWWWKGGPGLTWDSANIVPKVQNKPKKRKRPLPAPASASASASLCDPRGHAGHTHAAHAAHDGHERVGARPTAP